jgi:hypothetical protein
VALSTRGWREKLVKQSPQTVRGDLRGEVFGELAAIGDAGLGAFGGLL